MDEKRRTTNRASEPLTGAVGCSTVPFDPHTVRADFPFLEREVNGHPLAYLDNAASTQKPQAGWDAPVEFYRAHASHVHRGVHTLSEETTIAYEYAQEAVAAFIGAQDPSGVEAELSYVSVMTEDRLDRLLDGPVKLVAFCPRLECTRDGQTGHKMDGPTGLACWSASGTATSSGAVPDGWRDDPSRRARAGDLGRSAGGV